ncbi:MAG: multidrug ABC transporter permease [Ignavibacteria bacterium RIFOXYC2_FULL_35_16]|nr:MAG: multidrug ABC transporter permease [Ignavibacteria bacterium GWA2_36_19]OGU53034.1 MAG: multidrug ABC transporter permease [Ignavibacteria bacterium GWC2_35_8]OGU62178.1 MAG: multidrug ABC transporter permease [Ignavibacteria bacterium GWF2_35_20]OGU82215.1 MAG: multidrug ABC transporter permease [Ignavibacteria bacterium RIFOXYA2_FULL_35_9]OGU84584.1 MAG: multidrug ABC transporter permease [Ignavibacteria bacterium RIFOXYA12_FULL_35_25]OGU96854.1 MAG: multidrug ABC transporter permeas
MFNRIYAIAKKEFRQLKRDTRMLFIVFFFPVVLLAIFGYAINFDVHHIKIAVYDQDKSDYTRDYLNGLLSSDYFDLVQYIDDENEIKKLLDEKIVQVVIVFPNDLSRKLNNNQEVKVQYLVDGVDGNTANVIVNYVNAATFSYSLKLTKEYLAVTGKKIYVPINLEPRFWFNPELESTKFLIPGLMGMILIITAVVSVSLSIVREKERGTIEQINVSPLSSFELIIGKTVPYIVISLINASIVLIAGYLLFGIEIKGSILLLLIGTFAFLFAALGLGIFISSVADSQQVAFQAANVSSLLPSLILSGFIFPIESMPTVIQWVTNITPAKFFIVILRAILLRGVGLSAFWDQLLYLLIFGTIFIALATLVNKKAKAA